MFSEEGLDQLSCEWCRELGLPLEELGMLLRDQALRKKALAGFGIGSCHVSQVCGQRRMQKAEKMGMETDWTEPGEHDEDHRSCWELRQPSVITLPLIHVFTSLHC